MSCRVRFPSSASGPSRMQVLLPGTAFQSTFVASPHLQPSEDIWKRFYSQKFLTLPRTFNIVMSAGHLCKWTRNRRRWWWWWWYSRYKYVELHSPVYLLLPSSSSSSRMRVINHNWSATKQRPHLAAWCAEPYLRLESPGRRYRRGSFFLALWLWSIRILSTGGIFGFPPGVFAKVLAGRATGTQITFPYCCCQ